MAKTPYSKATTPYLKATTPGDCLTISPGSNPPDLTFDLYKNICKILIIVLLWKQTLSCNSKLCCGDGH